MASAALSASPPEVDAPATGSRALLECIATDAPLLPVFVNGTQALEGAREAQIQSPLHMPIEEFSEADDPRTKDMLAAMAHVPLLRDLTSPAARATNVVLHLNVRVEYALSPPPCACSSSSFSCSKSLFSFKRVIS